MTAHTYLVNSPRIIVLVVGVLRVHRLQFTLNGRLREERGLEELREAVCRALELRRLDVEVVVRRLRGRVLFCRCRVGRVMLPGE